MKTILKRLHDATIGPQGHGWLTRAEFDQICQGYGGDANPLLQIDSSRVNGDAVAAKLSPFGVDFSNKLHASAPKHVYSIEDDVPVPEKKSGRGSGLIPRVSEYPFTELQIGQSFVVAKKDAEDEPYRRMSSVVSGTNRRLWPKRFDVFNDTRQPGAARVFRQPDATEPLPEPKKRARKPETAPAGTSGAFGQTLPPAAPASGFGTGFGSAPPVDQSGGAGPGFGSAPASGFGSGFGAPAANDQGGYVAPAGFGFGDAG